MVGTAKENLVRYAKPHDVNITFSYPSNHQNYGAQLTYISIIVHQTSDIGRAYVTFGGINQRYITVDVEAKNTYSFDYEAKFYGIN